MFIVVVCLRPPSKWLLQTPKQRQLKLSRRGRILLCFYGSLFCWLALTGWLACVTIHNTAPKQKFIDRYRRRWLHVPLKRCDVENSCTASCIFYSYCNRLLCVCVCESLSACMCKWVHFAFTGLLPVTSQLCRTVENSCTASLSYVGG